MSLINTGKQVVVAGGIIMGIGAVWSLGKMLLCNGKNDKKEEEELNEVND